MLQNKVVTIALATYNGEQHIKTQLDSILAHTYQNFKIVIRDDGSSDDTLNIVRDYQKRTDKITVLDSNGMNLKCPGSFYQILRECEKTDYYAFCDQDDIWYPEKIQWAVEKLQQEEEIVQEDEVPLLYLSSYDYYTEDGKFIRHFPIQKGNITVKNVIYYTPGSGFTLVFNDLLRQMMVLQCTPGNEMHDKWMIRGAACFGKIVYDPRSTARHIRYENSVTAEDAGNTTLLIHFVKDELLSDTAIKAKEYLKYYYDVFSEKMSKSDRETMEVFIKEPACFFRWLRKVLYPHRLRMRLSGELALRFLFLLGKI